MDALTWLSRWYKAQCDGNWEHGYGVSITNIDNPGWWLKIELAGTDCDGRTLDKVAHNYGHETDWWVCSVENNVFHGFSGPLHLQSLIETFRGWATNGPTAR